MNKEQILLNAELHEIKLRDFDISAPSRKSLKRLLDASQYYLDIYCTCLDRVLASCSKSPDAVTLVDYGGGHGLLGIMAKRVGFARVVYVDNSADSVQTVRQLSQKLGTSPDEILQGDAETLRMWCEQHSVKPDALVAIDVIEHIYILDEFFASLHALSPDIKMVFTTASTPFNKRVARGLHKAMERDELGTTLKKGFWKMRRDYIKEHNADMSDRELDFWADNTRGLIFDDVIRAVESHSPNLLRDKYNTCDPRTGSWTERILPVDDYRELLSPYDFTLTVLPGRYNHYRRGPKAWFSRCYNKRIDKAPDHTPVRFRERRLMRRALKYAPFIYLIAT